MYKRQTLELQKLRASALMDATQAERNRAEAANVMVEAQLKPAEVRAKTLSAATQNLPNADSAADKEFDKRVKLATLMLKEKDINNNLEVVRLQTEAKKAEKSKDNDFLQNILEQ